MAETRSGPELASISTEMVMPFVDAGVANEAPSTPGPLDVPAEIAELTAQVEAMQSALAQTRSRDLLKKFDERRAQFALVLYLLAALLPIVAIANLMHSAHYFTSHAFYEVAGGESGRMQSADGVTNDVPEPSVLRTNGSKAPFVLSEGVAIWVLYALPVVASLFASAGMISAAKTLQLSIAVLENAEAARANHGRRSEDVTDGAQIGKLLLRMLKRLAGDK